MLSQSLNRYTCKRCKRTVAILYSKERCARCHVEVSFKLDGKGDSNLSEESMSIPEPTNALPGTDEKVEVLAKRRQLGEKLWHPLDAGMDGWKNLLENLDLDVPIRCLARGVSSLSDLVETIKDYRSEQPI